MDQGEDYYWGIMPSEDLQKQQRGKKEGGGKSGRGKKKKKKKGKLQVIETPSFWLTDARARDTTGFRSQWAAAADRFHSGKSIDNLL